MPKNGWWEDRKNVTLNLGEFLSSGGGGIGPMGKAEKLTTKSFMKLFSITAEPLSISGGTLVVDLEYWKNNPSNSLLTLLNNKRYDVLDGKLGYKATVIGIFDEFNVRVATITLQGFALGVGISGRSGTTTGDGQFERKPMNRDDSLKIAKKSYNIDRPNLSGY